MKEKKKSGSWLVYALLSLLLIISGLRMIQVSWTTSLTYDEPVHIAAGLLYWESGSFRYNREHPPLMKLIAAAPSALLGAKATFTAHDGEKINESLALSHKWHYADRVVYDNEVDHLKLTRRARMMMILVTLFFGVIAFSYARSLFGPLSGLVAASLFLLDPNILAHGTLVKNDMGLAGLVFTSFYFLHRYHRTERIGNAFAASAFLALACGTKLSALAVWGIFCPLAIAVSFQQLEGTTKRRALVSGGIFIMLFLFADLVLNAVYGFGSLHEFEKGIGMLTDHREIGHPSFLLGKISNSGWYYYFPVVLALKNPLPVLALWLAGLVSLPKLLRDRGALNLGMLLLPPLVLFAFSVNSRVNIGIRHVLILFPFFAVLASGIFSREVLGKKLRRIAGALVILLIPISLLAHPNHLSYFNAFGGGPDKKAQLLSDSNLDWGQDLPRLKQWMDDKGVERIYLRYFGTARPSAFGITAVPLRVAFQGDQFRPSPDGPRWVAISTTHFQGVYGREYLVAPFKEKTPDAILGDTFRLYQIPSAGK